MTAGPTIHQTHKAGFYHRCLNYALPLHQKSCDKMSSSAPRWYHGGFGRRRTPFQRAQLRTWHGCRRASAWWSGGVGEEELGQNGWHQRPVLSSWAASRRMGGVRLLPGLIQPPPVTQSGHGYHQQPPKQPTAEEERLVSRLNRGNLGSSSAAVIYGITSPCQNTPSLWHDSL